MSLRHGCRSLLIAITSTFFFSGLEAQACACCSDPGEYRLKEINRSANMSARSSTESNSRLPPGCI